MSTPEGQLLIEKLEYAHETVRDKVHRDCIGCGCSPDIWALRSSLYKCMNSEIANDEDIAKCIEMFDADPKSLGFWFTLVYYPLQYMYNSYAARLANIIIDRMNILAADNSSQIQPGNAHANLYYTSAHATFDGYDQFSKMKYNPSRGTISRWITSRGTTANATTANATTASGTTATATPTNAITSQLSPDWWRADAWVNNVDVKLEMDHPSMPGYTVDGYGKDMNPGTINVMRALEKMSGLKLGKCNVCRMYGENCCCK